MVNDRNKSVFCNSKFFSDEYHFVFVVYPKLRYKPYFRFFFAKKTHEESIDFNVFDSKLICF